MYWYWQQASVQTEIKLFFVSNCFPIDFFVNFSISIMFRFKVSVFDVFDVSNPKTTIDGEKKKLVNVFQEGFYLF